MGSCLVVQQVLIECGTSSRDALICFALLSDCSQTFVEQGADAAEIPCLYMN